MYFKFRKLDRASSGFYPIKTLLFGVVAPLLLYLWMQRLERTWVWQVSVQVCNSAMYICSMLTLAGPSIPDAPSHNSVDINGIQTCPSSSYIANVVG